MSKCIVNNCLKKINNKFILVVIAVLRTKQLMRDNIKVSKQGNKQLVALKEIANGSIVIHSRSIVNGKYINEE